MSEKQIRQFAWHKRSCRWPLGHCDCGYMSAFKAEPDAVVILRELDRVHSNPFTEVEGAYIANELRVFVEDKFGVHLTDGGRWEWTDGTGQSR